jgi:acetyltransferase-like isoleucine patch superfamily enzyme
MSVVDQIRERYAAGERDMTDLGPVRVPAGTDLSDLPGLVLGDWCRLGDRCVLGDWCRLGFRCELGSECRLGPGCRLGDECVLGSECRLGAGCRLGDECVLGDRCELGDRCGLGARCRLGVGCVLEDRCVLGDRCELGARCRLGAGCELGARCVLGPVCVLGDWCWLGPGCRLGSGCVDVPVVAGLAGAVLRQIVDHPETYDQGVWHSECGTQHCAAGWAVVLAGDAGRALESRVGTRAAAEMLLRSAHGDIGWCPFGADDDPRPWLRDLAERDESEV